LVSSAEIAKETPTKLPRKNQPKKIIETMKSVYKPKKTITKPYTLRRINKTKRMTYLQIFLKEVISTLK
jgi:hypothetical protein